MILGRIQDLRDDPALARHAQALVAAGALDGVRPARFGGYAVPNGQDSLFSLRRLISDAPDAGYRLKAMVRAETRVPSAFW
jgi:hypothetical protein